MSVLLIYPTHENCAEAEQMIVTLGITARAYPLRTTVETGLSPQNCWNREADEAEQLGLPVTATVCEKCRFNDRCRATGYLAGLQQADAAFVALATHKRAELVGLNKLAEQRLFVSVHENPIGMLRQEHEIQHGDILIVKTVLDHALNDPRQLDWFGESAHAETRDRLYAAVLALRDLVEELLQAVSTAKNTESWAPTVLTKLPSGLSWLLFNNIKTAGVRFRGRPWPFLLKAIEGKLASVTILVTERPATRSAPARAVKVCVGYEENPPPESCTVWFNDATLAAEDLEAVLQRSVQDATPQGRLDLRKKAVQIPVDVTRRKSSRMLISLVQGILADRPQFRRIGVITHQPQLPVLRELSPLFRERIVQHSYFGSGQDRSSNSWHANCDLVLILGTPRVPTEQVLRTLLQTRHSVIGERPRWGELSWVGRTETGQTIQIAGRGYHDPDWRAAHQSLVRASLIQAIGRGRGLLESGCEVLVVSNEECGVPISDAVCEPLNQREAEILEWLRQDARAFPIRDYIENARTQRDRLLRQLHLSAGHARRLLSGLEQRGLLRKHICDHWVLVGHFAADAAEPLPQPDLSVAACSSPDIS